MPIIPKVLEAQFSGMTGHGIGRYGAAQLPDVTFNPNGKPLPESGDHAACRPDLARNAQARFL
ncbi:MAG: hypothetical protein WBG11_05225 [Methylocella sp.]